MFTVFLKQDLAVSRTFVEDNFETDVDLEACDPVDWEEEPQVCLLFLFVAIQQSPIVVFLLCFWFFKPIKNIL